MLSGLQNPDEAKEAIFKQQEGAEQGSESHANQNLQTTFYYSVICRELQLHETFILVTHLHASKYSRINMCNLVLGPA